MMPLVLHPAGPVTRILCLGAHCDDIEIGCGGALLRLLAEQPKVEVRWVVFCSNPARAAEADACARRFLQAAPGSKIQIEKFRDGFLPYHGGEVKDYFEKLEKESQPDLIFTHTRHDAHQDHRLICELTWNTWRNHLVLEYEIPKYDGDLGSPNFFIPLTPEIARRKIEAIMEGFGSQRDKHWFTPDTFMAILRIRGLESVAPDGLAEGFYCRKLVI